MTDFAPSSAIDKHQARTTSLGITNRLTGVALLVVLAIAVYLASRSPGTSLDQLMSMTAFP